MVAPLTTTYISLRYQKATVRREVKWKMIAGLEKEELVLLKFTEIEEQEQIKWEHSEEFEYNNEMYDIIEKEINCDTTYYWCWRDNKETQLNKQLDDLLVNELGGDHHNNDTQKRLSSIFKSLYYCETGVIRLTLMPPALENSHYSFSNISFLSSPPVPPPEIG